MAKNGIPVAEAAQKLGITTDALRKRVLRGQAQGYHDKNRLYVIVTDDDAVHETEPNQRRDTSSQSLDSVETASRELVDTLRDEVAFLRRELESRSAEVERLHVLLQTGLRQLPATIIEAPESHMRTQEAQSSTTMPNAPHDGAGAAERATERPQRWPWWMRILGGK